MTTALSTADLAAHRSELLRHCYRMLGSLGDAEDQVQETLLKAWQHRDRFEGRASVRTWLFRIATNACLDALDKRAVRELPQDRGAAAELGAELADRITDPIWLEPYPDDPELATAQREAIGLAFVAMLQRLPPRQRAVLLLRDVVGWETKEIAVLLDTTAGAIEAIVHRARETVGNHDRDLAPSDLAHDQRELLGRYLAAWQCGDVAAIVATLRADAVFAMPPVPTWFRGRAAIQHFLSTNARFQDHLRAGFRLTPIAANGGPGFAVYRSGSALGIMVVALDHAAIASVTTFLDPNLFARFGLAPTI